MGVVRGAEQWTVEPLPDPGPGPPVEEPGPGPDLAALVGRVLAVLGFVIGARPIADNSFLTHLATGRLIVDGGSVPSVDPYSALAAGDPWTVQSWLVSVVYAALEAGPGPSAIRVGHGLAAVAVVAGLWALVAPARSLVVRAGLTGLVLVIGTFLWSPRPLLVGLVGLVVVLLAAAGRLGPWWLVPVFWVWANSHGSFVLGGGLTVLIAVGAAIDDRRLPRRDLTLVAAASLGSLAAMAGPLGWRVLWFPLHLLARGDALDNVAEWTSPTFRGPVERAYLVLLVVLVVAASRRAPWRSLLPAIVFFVSGLLAVRNLGPAAVVMVGLLAPSLDGWLGEIDGSVRSSALRLGGAAMIVVGLAVAAVTATAPALALDDYPEAEVDWLAERALVADPEVLVAHRDLVGNYLHLRFGAEARVFVDDRFDFHPAGVLEDHADLLGAGDHAEIVARNRFDVVLWEADTPFHRWLEDDAGWRIALADDDWVVACRTDGVAAVRCRD